MEDAVKSHNRGVLPADLTVALPENSSVVSETHDGYEENPGGIILISPDEPTGSPPETAEYPHEYTHVRSPELKRGEYLILMSASAVCGAIGGVILALSGKADPWAIEKIIQGLSSGFGNIFFQRTLIGAAFLLAEYILGFFALGDLLVWAAPLCCAMGLSLRIAATESWILLPSAIVTLIACVIGAATSSGFSRALMRLSRGGTVHLGSSPRQKYTINFLGYLAAIIAGAIYEGAIL